MAVDLSQCDAVILAGGQSRRMGSCKALLPWNGEPLIRRIAEELGAFETVWVSANDPTIAQAAGLPCVGDRYTCAGPLAGLHAALCAAEKEYLLCIPCDLPNVSSGLFRLLMENMDSGLQALVCRDGQGTLHPLCGIYHRSALPVLKNQLDQKQYKVRLFLNSLSFRILDTAGILQDSVFFNMNTPEDYQDALSRQTAASGPTGSA